MTQRLREDTVRDLAIRYGVAANAVAFAATADEAGRIAESIGREVAIKLVADNVVHKSKAGGVLLAVAPEQARERTAQMLAAQQAAGAQIRGVTVEAMVDTGIEAVVGGLDADGFGPVVMFGHGGVDIETLDDVVFALAPIDENDARQMIARTRLGQVIAKRFPDRLNDVVDMLLAVGGWVRTSPQRGRHRSRFQPRRRHRRPHRRRRCPCDRTRRDGLPQPSASRSGQQFRSTPARDLSDVDRRHRRFG
ncbi:acetate--CoA ligase family protein [Rhodococcus sp. CX]|uniref:acetate--CoA ligase family protein n=1 Tax=Rhodococcus sp. CX TaxID=2789880 RepID=UPI001E51295E|nr:acetate--CoA ligase family protein [Rhodococcus sp. CX]